jgi:hypothetical protein
MALSSILLKVKVLMPVLFIFFFYSLSSPADEKFDWRSDWSLKENFDISIDTEGYRFPTAIAFVPNPGNEPKDPLYFVTELRGKVKVVTNDRTVFTFAEDFFTFKPLEELPSQSGEIGLAGICLDPENGYLFVTFVYQDNSNVLRNNIVRFQSEPGRFSLEPTSMLAFTEIFSNEITSVSHQIGPCQVYNHMLYVGVGDGHTVSGSDEHEYNTSQSADSLLGKILRMTLDGKPVKSNPFYVDDDITKAKNFVWALGLRNPFGLKIVDGRVFVADNGPHMDRFLEVHEGGNYLWNGTDWSIGASSAQIVAPSTGMAQLDFLPKGSDILPEEFSGMFYLALCGSPIAEVVAGVGRGIITLSYGFEDNKMLGPPQYILRYGGSRLQLVVGLGVGPDGIYFAPLFPDAEGRSYVLKIRYEKGASYPYSLRNEKNANEILQYHGCFNCHTLNGDGWGTSGPKLDREQLVERIGKRLVSPEYVQAVDNLNRLDTEPYRSFKEARKDVLERSGLDKINSWVKYHIMEPRFDNPYSQMPNMRLSEQQSQFLADFLVYGDTTDNKELSIRMWEYMKRNISKMRYRYIVAYSFVIGALTMFLAIAAYGYYKKRTKTSSKRS